MSVPCVPLAEVCEINPATDYKFTADEPCTFVPMEAMDDVSARITSASTRPFRELQKGYTVFAEDDVLIAKITPCMENGKCAIARRLRNGIGFGSTEFHVLRASKHTLPQWLFYFWRLPATRSLAERNMTGSAGQKRVSTNFLETLKIPLPPLSEQRRIVELLDQADRLRRTRRYARELSDTFLPAAFLELFGDPGSNPRDFPRIQVEDLLATDREGTKCGPFGSALKKYEYVSTGIPVWTMDNVSENDFQEEGCLYITERKYQELAAYSVQTGDILISRAGTVGRMAVVRTRHKRSIIHTNLIRLSLNPDRILPVFFVILMTWFGQCVARLKRGQEDAYTFMSTGSLGQLWIPLPPMPLQERLASLVSRHKRLQAGQREALREADHLFQSLLHQVFAHP